MEFIKEYFEELKRIIDLIPAEDVKKIAEIIYYAYLKNKQVFIIGNGGSASTSSHFACDLGKGTLDRIYSENDKRFRVISMTDNVSTITAYSNDVGYDNIFSQQLNNLITEGDVLIVITGSGNSKNIIKAVKLASRLRAITIGFLGFDGGEVKNLLDYYILVPSNHYGKVEDVHSILTHLISSYIIEMKKKNLE